MSKFDATAYLADRAHKNGLEYIDDQIALYERAVREMKSYRNTFERTCNEDKGHAAPSDVITWVMNEAQNVARNVRFDLGAKRCAELTLVEHLKREEAYPSK